jgi:Nif-specific regulatory protein
MQALFHEASLIAPSESRVLVTGESGVGKEVLADVIHAWSSRVAGPLVKVNCAAIPETLLESELFGHEKGSFTGAVAQRIGRFEVANGGTIFLDEIADMSAPLRPSCLRVTQQGRFHRVGGNKELQTNARILAPRTAISKREVKTGGSAKDLFYRLNVVELNIPPLRERKRTFCRWPEAFVAEFSREQSTSSPHRERLPSGLSLARQCIRELRNAMARGAALRRQVILPEHLPAKVRQTAPSPCRPNPWMPSNWVKSNARRFFKPCATRFQSHRDRQGPGHRRRALCSINSAVP